MSRKVCFSLMLATACSAQASDPGVEEATPDAGKTARVDAAQNPNQMDAAQDAPGPTGDGCVQQVTQLLKNAAFDQSPIGTAWTQTLIDFNAPLVTDDLEGVPSHTQPYKAWLGGLEGLTTTVTDTLVQSVTIPANTTHLVLTGMYDVRTGEAPGTTVYDTAKLVITETDGTVIATVLSLSNAAPTTAWTMFGHAFTQNLSGKTVRVRLTSTNDQYDATSFYFDSLALTATHACALTI